MGRREAAEAAGVHLCELHVWSVQAHFASHPAHGSCKSPEAFWAVAIACTLAAMNACVSGCSLPPGDSLHSGDAPRGLVLPPHSGTAGLACH